MEKPITSPLVAAVGAALISAAATAADAGQSPFVSSELASGYSLASADGEQPPKKDEDEKKKKEGKCGEGKCGGMGATSGA